jgi:hypothetical protein
MKNFLELKSLRQNEINKTQSFLEKWYVLFSEKDSAKAIADTLGYTRMQDLLQQKIQSLNKSDPEYLSKFLDYSNLAFKDITKRLDNVQKDMTKAVEQKVKDTKGTPDDKEVQTMADMFYANLHIKSKARDQFNDKDGKFMSQIKEELSSIEKGTPSGQT